MIKVEDNIVGKIEDDDAATLSERMFLYSFVRALKPKVVVEIGTHKGLTAIYLATALYHNGGDGILHTTDPFHYEQETYINKFPELKKFIRVHHQRGAELDVNDVDFLFVDGFHEERHVLEEMNHFMPRLTEKAVVVFHDCGGDNAVVGVNSAITKLGLQTAFLPTDNKMRIYGKYKP
ncbi:MAG: methyltransferase [Siphoviridae sp. cttb18]|nr:MAG: methyltransferase [Siphoviridae sp. cttb18]